MELNIEAPVVATLPPNWPVVGGMNITSSMITGLIATGILLVLALLVRILLVPRMKEVPGRLQSFIELVVDWMRNYTNSKIQSKSNSLVAVFLLSALLFVAVNGLLELGGLGILRPATSDLSCTAALALMTFILIQYTSIQKKHLLGRVKSYGKPMPFIAPIKMLTDLAVPVSLACRMFGNILGGMVVMELLYSIPVLAFVFPAVLALYFTLFHTGMQAFIFDTLSLAFIDEALE